MIDGCGGGKKEDLVDSANGCWEFYRLSVVIILLLLLLSHIEY